MWYLTNLARRAGLDLLRLNHEDYPVLLKGVPSKVARIG